MAVDRELFPHRVRDDAAEELAQVSCQLLLAVRTVRHSLMGGRTKKLDIFLGGNDNILTKKLSGWIPDSPGDSSWPHDTPCDDISCAD